jgi:hypothetical protein
VEPKDGGSEGADSLGWRPTRATTAVAAATRTITTNATAADEDMPTPGDRLQLAARERWEEARGQLERVLRCVQQHEGV